MAIDRDAAVHARLYLRAIAEANRGHDGRRTETIGKSTPRRFNDPDDVVHRPDRKVELTIEVERGGEQRRHNGHCVVAHCDYADRSEEHTSEIESLMRISYDVFCLQKQHKKN